MGKKRSPRPPPAIQPPAPRPAFLRHLAVLLLLAAAGAAIYYPSLGAPFLFDDHSYITGNPLIRDFSAFSGGAALPSVNENVDIHFRTRAAAFFTFALNYAAGGLDPAGYRVFNLALHVLNSFLVYWLGLLLFAAVPGRAGGAAHAFAPGAALAGSAAAALLFLCHPLQTQAVAYVAQRFTSLCALFCLLSLACYLRARLPSGARSRAWFYAAALLAAVAAMKTKENAFPLPFMIAGAEFLFFCAPLKTRLKFLLPLALTALIIPAGLMFGGGQARTPAQALTAAGGQAPDMVSYALSQPEIVVSYLRLLAWPSGQNADHDPPLRRAPGLPAAAALLLLGALAAGGVRLALSGGTLRAAAGFGIIWFFAMISVESSFIPLGDLMFEHRVYLPAAGLALAAGALVAAQFRKGLRVRPAAAALLLCAGLGWAARDRVAVWAGEEALWRDAAVKSPLKARPHYNLGSVLVRQERFAEGAAELELALAAAPENPDNADVYYNLGLARARLEDFPRAEAAFLAAQGLNPRRDSAYFNLGLVYFKQGKTALARRQFKAALAANPGHAKARAKLEQLGAGLVRPSASLLR
jgi:tetratricopeptide (TPR) repeat protein